MPYSEKVDTFSLVDRKSDKFGLKPEHQIIFCLCTATQDGIWHAKT